MRKQEITLTLDLHYGESLITLKMYIKTKANKIVQEQNESLNRNPGIL